MAGSGEQRGIGAVHLDGNLPAKVLFVKGTDLHSYTGIVIEQHPHVAAR